MNPTHAIISYPNTRHECWHLGWLAKDGRIHLSTTVGDSGTGQYTGSLQVAYAAGDRQIMRDLSA